MNKLHLRGLYKKLKDLLVVHDRLGEVRRHESTKLSLCNLYDIESRKSKMFEAYLLITNIYQ
jgi:hypothetical protein